MSSRILAATGNFTTAATWKVASAVASAEVDSNAATFNLTNSNSDSATFIPAATNIDGVAIKISAIITPTGTLTVKLRNSTAGSDAATVTINASDLQPNARGWHVFTFAAVTPNGTDSYLIRVSRSVADGASDRITLFASTASAANMSRMVRLVTTGAPASGDKLCFAGEFTGAGTSTTYTCTHDNTATTSFGPTVSGGPPEGVTVNDKAIWQMGASASTNYYFKTKGVLAVNAGGRMLWDNATGTTGSITGVSNRGAFFTVQSCFSGSGGVIQITTTAAHNLSTNDFVVPYGLVGVTGVTSGNVYKITVIDSTNFSLNGTTFGGAWKYQGIVFSFPAITSTAHGLSDGAIVTITGVGGAAQANGAWRIRNADANTFLLEGGMCTTTFTGAYTSGGTWASRTSIPSTSTAILEFDSVANVDSGLELYDDSIVTTYGPSKTMKTTVKSVATNNTSDANSCNTLVTTSGTGVTWVEGQPFVVAWGSDGTKTFTLRQGASTASYTISTVNSVSSITATGTITTGASVGGSAAQPAVFSYTGTSANKVLHVEDTTGWAANDSLFLASSSQFYQDGEAVTISSVDSATQVTLSAAMTGYHSGLSDANGDVRAEVMMQTCGVKIRGVADGQNGYIHVAQARAKIVLNYTEVYQVGSSTANKKGITTVGGGNDNSSFAVLNCSLRNFYSVSSTAQVLIGASGTSACYPILRGTNLTNVGTAGTSLANSSGGCFFIDSCQLHSNLANTNNAMCDLSSMIGIFTNNTLSGQASNYALKFSGGTSLGVFQNTVIHSSNIAWDFNSAAITFGTWGDGTASHQRIWRMSSTSECFTVGGALFPNFGATRTDGFFAPFIDGMTFYGNHNCGIKLNSSGGSGAFYCANITMDAGANFLQPNAVVAGQLTNNCVFDNCLFGQTTALTELLLNGLLSGYLKFRNCKFANANWVSMGGNQYGMWGLFVVSTNHNQVSGAYETWYSALQTNSFIYKISRDTGITYNSVAQSIRCANSGSLTNKARSPVLMACVNSGGTVTPSIYVRESVVGDGAAYNGSAPRLILMANPSIGVAVDTVVATWSGSAGSWVQVTGTSPSFTGQGVALFCVDYDGTAGWINLDNWQCTGAQDPTQAGYPSEFTNGPVMLALPAGGGGGGAPIIGSSIVRGAGQNI